MFYIYRIVYLISLFIIVLPFLSYSYDAPTFYEDEIVVTASRHIQLASESPFNITVITSEEIRSSGGKNVGDVLKNKLGIYPKSKGFLGSEYSLSLRGSSYQQVLVMVDGVKVNSPLLGGADAGDLTLNNVERIEVVRGPLSSMYGADAVGGVVNIMTRNARQSEQLAVDMKVMEEGASRMGASVRGESIMGDYIITLGHDDAPGYRDNSAFFANSLSSKLTRDIDGGSIELLYKTYSAKKQVPGSTVFPYSSAWQTDNNDEAVFTGKKSFGDNVLQAKLYHVQKLQKVNLDPDNSPDEKYNSFTGGMELQTEINALEGHKIICGAEYKGDGCDSTYAGIRSVVNNAFFVEDENAVNENLKINYGGRIDSHSIFGSSSNPRMGILYRVDPQTCLRAVYGESFRAPTLNDLYWYSKDPVWGTIMRGNEKLKPERSRNTELGMKCSPIKECAVDISVYSNYVDNLIQWIDISGTWTLWEARNIGKADITGAELGINYNIAEGLELMANYTHQQAFDSKTKKRLVYRPQDQYNAGANYSDGYGNIFSCNLRCVGERFDNESNTSKVPPYSVFDVRCEKVIDVLSYYVGAENLFNTEYEDTLNYPMPGRIYYFGVKYVII